MPAAIERDTAICGQPLLACHAIHGDQSTSAMAAPDHTHGLRSSRRGPAMSTPASSPTARKAGSGLFSSPSPSTTPATGQSRSSPVRTARTTSQLTSVHTSRSSVDVLSRWPLKRTIVPTAAHAAARARARGRPPSSPASSPVSSTMRPAAIAEGMRRTVRDPGAMSLMSRATSGVTGPWSA